MANFFISNNTASTGINNVGAQLNGGFMDIYFSTQPANANTNTTAQNYILAELTFSTVAGTVVTSTFTAQSIVATTATSTGIASFYRVFTSSRAGVVCDGSVSTAGADLNFNSNNFATGVSVQVTSYVLILPEGPS